MLHILSNHSQGRRISIEELNAMKLPESVEIYQTQNDTL